MSARRRLRRRDADRLATLALAADALWECSERLGSARGTGGTEGPSALNRRTDGNPQPESGKEDTDEQT